MNTEELLEKMKEMNTEALIHELREARRRAIDFMDAQQGFLLELKKRPAVAETPPEPEPVKEEAKVEVELPEPEPVKEEAKVEAPPEPEAELDTDFFISQDDLDSIIQDASKTEQPTEKNVNVNAEYKKDLDFSDSLSITLEEAEEAIVESQLGKISPHVDYKPSNDALDQSEIDALLGGGDAVEESGALDQSEIDALLGGGAAEESGALDQSEIDALLGGGDTAEEPAEESGALDQSEIDALLGGGDTAEEPAEEEFSMLDQDAINDLLEGFVEEPALAGIDLEELAEVAEKEEALDDAQLSKLLENAASVEQFDVIGELAPQEKTVYEKVDRAEVMELQVQLKKARERKKIEDKKERERIKQQGRAEMNVNKKKPTAEEIQDRLIDTDEASALDEELKQLKKMKKGDK